MQSIMRVSAILFATLAGIWLVLSGYFSAFLIVCGLFACALTLIIIRKIEVRPPDRMPLYLQPAIISYAFWLVAQMFLSALSVIRAVWQIERDISPTLAWVPSLQRNEVGQAVYAASITLTPGTVCTGVKNGAMQVHALHKSGIAWLCRHIMDEKIERLAGND